MKTQNRLSMDDSKLKISVFMDETGSITDSNNKDIYGLGAFIVQDKCLDSIRVFLVNRNNCLYCGIKQRNRCD